MISPVMGSEEVESKPDPARAEPLVHLLRGEPDTATGLSTEREREIIDQTRSSAKPNPFQSISQQDLVSVKAFL